MSASSLVMVSSGLPASVATPCAAGSPRFLSGSFPARCPHPPRKARQVLLPVASPPVSGFIIFGSLATFDCPANQKVAGSVTRPNRVYITLRLAGSPFEASPREIAPTLARLATCRTGNLHGELLSVHKIRQAYPGAPKIAKKRRLMSTSGPNSTNGREGRLKQPAWTCGSHSPKAF